MDTSRAGYIIVWTYLVSSDFQSEFEAAYQSNGDWAQFFQRDSAYLGTSLHHDANNALRYITVDYWLNKDAYEKFLKQWQKEYEALDAKFEGWTQSETLIGKFKTIAKANL